jgi:hypothetical protein
MPESSIYEQLTGVKVDDASVSQLDFTKNTFVDKKAVEYWKGVITISKILDASRTYPHGLPVPEASGIEIVTLSAGESGFLRPPGTEIWEIKGIVGTGQGGSATASVSWSDGASIVNIDTAASFSTAGQQFTYAATPPITSAQPLLVTNSLYMVFTETGGAQGIVFNIAIHKVSL